MVYKDKPTIRLEGIVKAEPFTYPHGSISVAIDVTRFSSTSFLGGIYFFFMKRGLKRSLKGRVQLSCTEVLPFSIEDKVVVYTTEDFVCSGLPTWGSPRKFITDVFPLTVKYKGQTYSFTYP